MATLPILHLKLDDLHVPTKGEGSPRGKNEKTIADYAEQLKIVKDWPFPNLLVTQQQKKDKKSGEFKPTGKWIVLGGQQRTKAAEAVDWKHTIPCEQFRGKQTDEDRWGDNEYFAMIRDNMKHGLRFSESERDKSYKDMREMGATIEEIAKEWHCHKSSVSRRLRELTTVAARSANSAASTEELEGSDDQPTDVSKSKGKNDVLHFFDFLKERFEDCQRFLLDSKPSKVAEYRELVIRLAEIINEKVEA
jgi:hypothetical protein